MKYTRDFIKVSKNDAALAGGKGASLGEMTQAGIPVPPGFVIMSEAFDHFLDLNELRVEIDGILHGVDHQKMHTVERASELISELILEEEIPAEMRTEIENAFAGLDAKYVAVRSSATAEDSHDAAWAGQLSSYLNTTKGDLFENIKKCWASLFTPRAIFYRFEKALHGQKISVAVVIQKMVQSEISGIAFSVHPVTEDYDQMIIEAGFGLGEAIVSGQITPDSYVVEKASGKIFEKNVSVQGQALVRKGKVTAKGKLEEDPNEWIDLPVTEGEKQKLSDKQILELAALIIRIENHYGFPCDIEWAYEKGKFYITQSRPITTLQKKVLVNEKRDLVKEYSLDKGTWTNKGFHGLLHAFFPVAIVTGPAMKSFFGDRALTTVFLSKDNYIHWYWHDEDLDRIREKFFSKLKAKKDYLEDLKKQWNVKVNAWTRLLNKIDKTDLTKLSDEELTEMYEQFSELYIGEYTYFMTIGDAISMHADRYLPTEFKKVLGDDFGDVFPKLLTTRYFSFIEEEYADRKVLIKQYRESHKINKLALDAHSKKYFYLQNNYANGGYVSTDDFEKMIKEDSLKSDEQDVRAVKAVHLQEKESLLKKYKLSKWQKTLLYVMDEFFKLQDTRKKYVLIAVYYQMQFLKELARRTGISIKLLYSSVFTEYKQILAGQFDLKELEERQKVCVCITTQESKLFVGDDAQKVFNFFQKDNIDPSEIKGSPSSKGKVRGYVKIILKIHDMVNMEKGDVLVSSMTRPEMVPVMKLASAIVTDEGGVTSHAAIVSRELGIPCIIGTKVATRVLKDGDYVEVDADKGVVRILDKGETSQKKNSNSGEIEKPESHYSSVALIKMGRWALAPLDTETWMTEETSKYFKELFGFPKGILNICTLEDGYIQNYVPVPYFDQLYSYIERINKKNYKALAQKLESFYSFKKVATKEVPKIVNKDPAKLNIKDLINCFIKNRDWVHRAAVYDQFGWIGESYWIKPMEKFLSEKLGLKSDEPEFHRILFVLTKPEQISTTLKEKRDVLKEAISVAKNRNGLRVSAKRLTVLYGWMPVFTFGVPWDETHYVKELEDLLNTDLRQLRSEYEKLKDYTKIRNAELAAVMKKYKLNNKDIQLFVDFGLMLDVRNEAEYLISYCAYHVLPVYDEISRRLKISVRELRNLFEKEVVACLKGELDVKEVLGKKGPVVAWGFDAEMNKRINFDPEESARLFKFIESTSALNAGGNAEKGICASPGKAIGKVKIVASPAEQGKVNNGDILFSYATTVDYLPAMKKASAIVTEVGGLTCHAAVVSREFGIPCVVSLKNAMENFKDGDLVEVDADQGTVRILDKGQIEQKKRDSDAGAGEIIKKINAGHWEKWLDRPFFAFTLSLFEDCCRVEGFEDIRMKGIGPLPQLFQNGRWYINQSELERVDKQIEKYLKRYGMKDVNISLEKFKERGKKEIEKVIAGKDSPQRKLAAVFKILTQACSYIWFAHGAESFFARKLKQEVPKYIKTDVDKFIGDAGFPSHKNLSAGLDEMMRSKAASREIAEKYGWVKIRDGFADPFSTEEIEEMRKELKPLMKHQQVKIPKALKPLFDEFSELVFYRTERTDVFYYLYYLARSVLKGIAKKYSIPFADLKYYRAKSLIKGKLEKFNPVFSCAFIDGKVLYQNDPIYVDTADEKKDVSGTIAFKGVIRGVVKIVKDTADLDKVKAGDILVTQMTFPSFIPAMNRASAFVTDEGGITCHAAIVAREMQKPCIIGTKNATRVLKDGDLVEVDADKGVVRKLDENESVLRLPDSSGSWYKLLAREGVDLPTISGVDEVFFDLVKRFGDRTDQRFFTIMKGRNITHYIGVEPKQLGRKVFAEYFDDPSYIRKYYEHGLVLLDSIRKVSGDWKKALNRGKLFEGFQDFREQFREICKVYSIFSWLSIESWQADFDDKLNEMIKRNGLESKRSDITMSAYKPWKKTALIEIQEKLAKGASPRQLADEYQFLRSWTVVWHAPITAEWVSNSKGETGNFGKFYTSKELISLLKPDRSERKFLELAPYVVFFKDWRDDVRRLHCYCWSFLLEKIAETFGLENDDLGYLSLDEIESSLQNNAFDKQKIQRRKEDSYVVVEGENGEAKIVDEVPDQINQIVGNVEKVQDGSLIKGKIAQKGIVRGTVKVVRSYHDIKHVEAGDILVANTTHPNYLPAMRKAAAFVTNEGGMISHAAIVAREMKKPCIVGTGNVTKLIQDGDYVEVDADKGIVRVLEGKDVSQKRTEDLDFLDKNWRKNWQGQWSILSCDFFGYHLTRQLKEAIGESLRENLYVSHRGTSCCYFTDEHKRRFAEYLLKQVKKDSDVLKKWAKDLKKNTDLILGLIKGLMKKTVNLADFERFISTMHAYGEPHRKIKVIVDYLPLNILEKYMKALQEARVYAEPVFENFEVYMRYVAGKIGAKEGVKPELVLAMTREQFWNYLKNGHLPDSAELKEKYEDSVLYVDDGDDQFYEGKERVAEIEKLLVKSEDVKELKGQSAYRGKARGRVRIVMDAKKIKDFNPGDILVTGMTRPEYIPFIQKSAGFITDAGGLLSHAAITARELKKACVIGTEVATKVLRDGDLVEVDADKGVVRILQNDDGTVQEGKDILPAYFNNLSLFVSRPETVQRDEMCGNFLWGSGGVRSVFVPIDDKNRAIYADSDDLRKTYENVAKRLSELKNWKSHLANYEKVKRSFDVFEKKISRANTRASLLKIMEEWVDLQKKWGVYAFTPFAIEAVIDPEFRQLLKTEMPDVAESILAIASTPSKLNAYQKMRLEILDAVMKKDTKAVKKLAGKWDWYGEYSSVEPPLDEKYFESEIKKLNINRAKIEKLEILKVKKNGQLYRQIIGRVKNKRLKLLAEILHVYTYLRTDRIERYKHAQFAMRKGYNRIAGFISKDTGDEWTRRHVVSLLNREILDYLKKGIVPDRRLMEDRIKGNYVYYNENGTAIVTSNKDFISRTQQILEKNISQEVRGLAAFSGKAVGKVVIVNDKNDLWKVKPGEIMVSRITMPDYTQAMKVAGALVTEEGGITSHAAIISRELKKPCIVGTGNCTKVLKDGDLVEVDADNGVVRVLKGSDKGVEKPSLLWATRPFATAVNQGFCEYSIKFGARKICIVPVGEDKGDYIVLPDFYEACGQIGKAFMKDADILLKEYEIRKQRLLKMAVKLSESAGEIADKDLAQMYRQYWKLADEFQPYLMFPHYAELKLEPEIAGKFPDDFDLVSSLPKPTEYSKMQKALFELDLKEVADEYGWLNIYAMTETPFDAAYFKEYKKLLKKEDVEKQYENIKRDNHKFSLFLKGLNKQDALKCRVMREFVYIRTDRIDVWKKHCYLLYRFFNYVGAKISRRLTIRESAMLFREEVLDILEQGNAASGAGVVTAADLIERGERKNLILVYSDKERVFIRDDKLKKELVEGYKKAVARDIKGVSAFKGIVEGRVKVYMNNGDITDDESGYVMACRHTSPSDLPVMKRAIAIVTDEGGVTCHAAIVARELKIPCIVGTKNATLVLKNNDLVEVDAGQGVVRILGGKGEVEVGKNNQGLKPDLVLAGMNWNMFVTRSMYIWHQMHSNYGNFHYYREWGLKSPFQCANLTVNGTITHVFKNSENVVSYEAAVLDAFSSFKRIKELKSKYVKFADELVGAMQDCLRELNLKNWDKFCGYYARYTCGLTLTAVMGRLGVEKLKKRLEDLHFKAEEIPRIISSITYPDEHTPLFRSSLEMLEIALKIQWSKVKPSSKKVDLWLKGWLARHGYIPVNFCDKPWALEDVKKQLDDCLKKDCKKEIAGLKRSHEMLVKDANKVLGKINDPEVGLMAKALQEATYLNEFRKNIFSMVSLRMRPLFAKIAKKSELEKWDDCYFLTPDESRKILQGEIKDARKIIKERDLQGVCVNGEGDLINMPRHDLELANQFIKSIHHGSKDEVTDLKTIKGFSANKGVVKGIARVIFNSKDFAKLLPGEILVTTMTSVDFVPIMSKAAAFVTNEGGITSHAAIVSREMGKPCIIGTKVATRVIKDGDYVEVDGNRGVVKIIKKASSVRLSEKSPIGTPYWDTSKNWTHYLTRPFTLFGASIWYFWYQSGLTRKLLGKDMPDVLYLEEHPNILRQYRIKEQLADFNEALIDLISHHQPATLKILKEGVALNKKAEKYLKTGHRAFKNLKQAVDFLVQIGIHSTVFPFWAFRLIKDLKIKNKDLNAVAEKLRGSSYYSRLFDKIIAPLAKAELKKQGIKNYNAYDLLSVSELTSGNTQKIANLLEQRLQQRKNKRHFIYQILDKREFIQWVDDVTDLIMKLEQMQEPESGTKLKQLKGQAAYLGKAKGIARVVLSFDAKNVKFNKGDILVSINSNPSLMPLLEKCSALVTDEGGVACHAAIISRELKKPCVMGTKIATSVIKDGDLVEVDADKGIVKVLKTK